MYGLFMIFDCRVSRFLNNRARESLSPNKEINKSKTIQCKKLRSYHVKEDEEICPSFRPVRFPKLQIFVEMVRRILQSPV